MRKYESYIEKLIHEIDNITLIVDTMFDNSTIIYHDPNRNSSIIHIGADIYHWSKKDEKSQLKAREKFTKFLEKFELFLTNANPSTLRDIKDANKGILNLINQNHAPASTDYGKKYFKEYIDNHKKFLNLLSESETITYVIPDTNAIVQFPDPSLYQKICDTEKFNFVIIPTVLSELDIQKNNHRNETYKRKVKSVITRLKGYRNQGDVLNGVTSNKCITIKMIATEPNFQRTLKWLDPKINDDRIIASALEIQTMNPSAYVILVTADMNLQNKAELAKLTVIDPDNLT
jgi:hypothetical protein